MRVLTFLFLLLLTSAFPMNGEFGGGVGTVDDPLVVEDVYDLQAIGATTDSLTLHYIQLNDIDASDTSNSSSTLYNDGAGFLPIGKHDSLWELREFRGSYQGNEHVISGLFINRPDEEYIGLFGKLASGAILEGVILEDVDITGSVYVGALAGWSGAKLTSCSSSGYVTGRGDETTNYEHDCATGGLIGWNEDGSVYTCRSSCRVEGTHRETSFFGGLIGCSKEGEIRNCAATGNVTARGDEIGGLVGRLLSYGSVMQCEARGDVTGETYTSHRAGGLIGLSSGEVHKSFARGNVKSGSGSSIGGLVGANSVGIITESFATGDVVGSFDTGGFAGKNLRADISNCYATGEITGFLAGGFAGYNDEGDISYCYALGEAYGSITGGLVGWCYDEDCVVRDSVWNINSEPVVGGYSGPYNEFVNRSFPAPPALRCPSATTEQFKQIETFNGDANDISAWDFSSDSGVWYMIEGRTPPLFRWKAKKDIKESLLGARSLTLEDRLRLDVNDDGIIDIADLVMLGE